MIEHIPEKGRKSKRHLGFFGDYEYFDRLNAGVYKAHRSDVIMPDGYRTGRWECTSKHWSFTESILRGTTINV